MAAGKISHRLKLIIPDFGIVSVVGFQNSTKDNLEIHFQSENCGEDPTTGSVLLSYRQFRNLVKRKEELTALVFNSGVRCLIFDTVMVKRIGGGLIRMMDLQTHHQMDVSVQGAKLWLSKIWIIQRINRLFLSGKLHKILTSNNML